jgi:hypothetical protein
MAEKPKVVVTSFSSIPVPTDYAPASSCSGVYYDKVFMIDNKQECLPDRFNKAATAFYSPGFECPSGYTAPAGCTRNDGVESITTVTYV